MSSIARAPHVACALSCVDILTALYFKSARVGPDKVERPDRDRVILSKGHASAALYACLAEAGFLDPATLHDYAADGSVLAEHPSRGTLPGVEVTSGSLGHGLGLGVGLALGARMRAEDWRVFVILSDGECNEGSTWEAALWAPAQGLANLTAIVDFNRFQAIGRSTDITALEPLADKWQAFGWDVREIDGHDFGQLVPVLERPLSGKPRAVIAHTIKGKGVSFMEGDLEWHYRPPSADDLRRALQEVG
jgi:transketolase